MLILKKLGGGFPPPPPPIPPRYGPAFNMVRLSLLQVMMVFCLFSFGKQVLPLFIAQYVDYRIHLACTVYCWPSLLSNNLLGCCTYKGL
jgi:hypothetical protein